MYIGGLDVGTSGCKITIYDDLGNFIENHYMEYESIHNGEYHEIDANQILKAVEAVIGKTIHTPSALGITSFGETFVLLDENDNILCNSMLYTDKRGGEEAKSFDGSIVKSIAYCTPHEMFSLPKLMWIKRNKPEIFSKAKRVLLIEDFVSYMLTGNRCIDYSLASRTMGFDIKNKKWSSEIFDMAEIDMSLFSTPVPIGSVVGSSCKFGLKNTVIVAGCHDQIASAIGAGALEKGYAVDGSGSVECVTFIVDSLPKNPDVCDMGYTFVPFLDNKYACYALSFCGGTALKWFKDSFAPDKSYKMLDDEVCENPGTILTLPYFAGAANPYMDIEAKATFYGITLSTSKAELYRSIMEGVAYEMKINMDSIGIIPKQMLATGGGSKSEVWLQIKSDICNVPITAIDAMEVGALGNVMVAACSVGACNSLSKAKSIFVKPGKTYKANKERHEIYKRYYEKYKLMYKSSKEWRI